MSFVDYEKKIINSKGKLLAALDIKCGNNIPLKNVINKIHNLSDENWYTIDKITDLKKQEIEFFDIIFFNDCDLKSDFKVIFQFNFNIDTCIYFNTNNFYTIILECLTKQERIKFFKKSDNNDYKILVTTIFKTLLKDTDFKVLEYKVGTVHVHSFIKTSKSMHEPFDADFEKVLEKIQTDIEENEYKKELTKTQRNDIWNYIVDDFLSNGGHINIEQMCRQIDIEDCNDQVVQDYITMVCNTVKTVGNQIEENLTRNTDEKLKLDFDITSLDNWNKFIQRYTIFAKQLIKSSIVPVQLPLPMPLLSNLKNVGGFSCFMDSILFAMFIQKQGFFVNELLNKQLSEQDTLFCSSFTSKTKALQYLQEFQKVLNNLAESIQKGESNSSCIPIQKHLRKCNDRTQLLMQGDQQDDADFLGALMEVFNLYPTIVEKEIFKSQDNKNWIKSSSTKSSVSIVQAYLSNNSLKESSLLDIIQQVQVNNYQNVPVDSWPKDENGNSYQFLATVEKIINTNQLVIHTPRKNFVNNKFIKNTTPVKFTEYIKHDNYIYELNAVTIHHGSASGGHYTCFCKVNGVWVHYDDMKETIKIVTFDNVLQENKNTSLFFYSPYKKNIEFFGAESKSDLLTQQMPKIVTNDIEFAFNKDPSAVINVLMKPIGNAYTFNTIKELVQKQLKTDNKTDQDILSTIAKKLRLQTKKQWGNEIIDLNITGRASSRVNDIKDCLPKKAITYIDIGAGNGEITYAISQQVHAEFTIAVDKENNLSEVYNNIPIHFMDDISALPDNTIDLITAFQSLHHISDLNKMLTKVHAVLKPNGIFIIREHDNKTPLDNSLAMIEHKAYAYFNKENEDNIEMRFISKEQWTRELENIGFKLIKYTPVRQRLNPTNVYYACYVKK